jgi:hypothetical protein
MVRLLVNGCKCSMEEGPFFPDKCIIPSSSRLSIRPFFDLSRASNQTGARAPGKY